VTEDPCREHVEGDELHSGRKQALPIPRIPAAPT
jgi:hypothetical protein